MFSKYNHENVIYISSSVMKLIGLHAIC